MRDTTMGHQPIEVVAVNREEYVYVWHRTRERANEHDAFHHILGRYRTRHRRPERRL